MDINEAWRSGYIKGYKGITGHIPPVPARPGSVPAGVFNQVEHFYKLGYSAGREAALKK